MELSKKIKAAVEAAVKGIEEVRAQKEELHKGLLKKENVVMITVTESIERDSGDPLAVTMELPVLVSKPKNKATTRVYS